MRQLHLTIELSSDILHKCISLQSEHLHFSLDVSFIFATDYVATKNLNQITWQNINITFNKIYP